MNETPAKRTERRIQRTMQKLAGVDRDIIEATGKLTDRELIDFAWKATGLTLLEFSEDVLMLNHWDVHDIRYDRHKLVPLMKRFLFVEVCRMLQRQRTGTIPDDSWCPSCGRGDHTNATARVKYVVPPSVETLFYLMRSED